NGGAMADGDHVGGLRLTPVLFDRCGELTVGLEQLLQLELKCSPRLLVIWVVGDELRGLARAFLVLDTRPKTGPDRLGVLAGSMTKRRDCLLGEFPDALDQIGHEWSQESCQRGRIHTHTTASAGTSPVLVTDETRSV